MTIEIVEGLDPLVPLDFFVLKGTIPYCKERPSLRGMLNRSGLQDTSPWLIQEHFAQVALGWNEGGVFVDLAFDKPFEEALYPRYQEGDSVELFFDTRDVKTAQFVTGFCHHFVFLPQAVQGIHAQEVTHFRTEDRHPLCNGEDLVVETAFHKKGYEMRLIIPSHCLHGWDPASFPRLGFSYRLNRFKGSPQLFSLSGQHFFLEQHPRFWASFALMN